MRQQHCFALFNFFLQSPVKQRRTPCLIKISYIFHTFKAPYREFPLPLKVKVLDFHRARKQLDTLFFSGDHRRTDHFIQARIIMHKDDITPAFRDTVHRFAHHAPLLEFRRFGGPPDIPRIQRSQGPRRLIEAQARIM